MSGRPWHNCLLSKQGEIFFQCLILFWQEFPNMAWILTRNNGNVNPKFRCFSSTLCPQVVCLKTLFFIRGRLRAVDKQMICQFWPGAVWRIGPVVRWLPSVSQFLRGRLTVWVYHRLTVASSTVISSGLPPSVSIPAARAFTANGDRNWKNHTTFTTCYKTETYLGDSISPWDL